MAQQPTAIDEVDAVQHTGEKLDEEGEIEY